MRVIRRSSSRASEEMNGYSSGSEDYEILEQIGRGETSIVYLAICKRGRLRNRQVALKKIPLSSSNSRATPFHLDISISLHQALHHPSIVSLLSAFATPSAHFHVLDLCSHGTLSTFLHARDPPILSEDELRGVLRSLIDALIYLKKELVIHGDIKPSSILLTGDYRIKLSDFGQATRLSTVNSHATTRCGSPTYASPEIVSCLPYSFTTDIWSLGCLVITCLSGKPPFEADKVSDAFKNVSQAAYTLPEEISFEVRDLIIGLLQIDPANRIQLSRIMSHSFFNPTLRITSLRPTPFIGTENCLDTKRSVQSNLTQIHAKLSGLPLFPPKPTVPHRGRHSDAALLPHKDRRIVLGDIGNTNLRNILYGEISSRAKIPLITGSTRRIVSDPLPAMGSLKLVPAASSSGSKPRMTTPSLESDSRPSYNGPFDHNELEAPNGRSKRKHPVSSPLDINLGSSEQTRALHLTCQRHWEAPVVGTSAGQDNIGPVLKRPLSPVTIPIGTTRPSHFTTLPLNPRTHKTVHGQITILPSRSLLIDFREGERRRGMKGDEVLVLDPRGTEIKVYSAPHLSVPCCLAEPISVFSMETLPPIYWKLYNDAARLIEQIKQRTPKLIMHKPDVKYILMANSPQSDIELLFRSSSPLQHHQKRESTDNISSLNPSMRLRLSRQHQSLELARYIHGSRGGEWTKKVLPTTDKSLTLSEADWTGLEDSEREGIGRLLYFLRVCEEIERLDEEETRLPSGAFVGHSLSSRNTHGKSLYRETVALSKLLPSRPPLKENRSPSTTISKSLASVHVTPRPPKLGAAPAVSWQIIEMNEADDVESLRNILSSTGDMVPGRNQIAPAGVSETIPEWGLGDLELTTESHGIQTRFIPSVGWCIRYGSRVSQGGRYRIMFLDGVSLDIDVDEEWAEFTSRTGCVTRHNIRDCNSRKKISERMKMFEEFVSMFDVPEEDQTVTRREM